ncbi:hypothetical protein IHQ72_33990 [Mesorhizobium onobrychidis]|uniref:Uncharacterized protein n=1 Tax=Mesorhizobium onobrychidis TaxID=2775404 RepID=A0ABY5QW23_9HYPH|nr:hypothetical protein IHQ72_33990 [Mesorhizobium onobrychidis]
MDFSGNVETDVVIICVPTPLSKNREPDLRFAQRRPATPHRDAIPPGVPCDNDLMNRRGHHMAHKRVEIVIRPVQVCRHSRDEATPDLLTVSVAQHHSGDLGDRVPLILRLERRSSASFPRSVVPQIWGKCRTSRAA